ncbi:MAG: beta-ketoacyl-ACP synthase II [Chloroflexota bacterium]|nr:beta-ketoacyl-ACP synthase II [Chloroflexota bacterium]
MNQSGRPRVLITGLGAVTPVGNDIPTMWSNLVEGRSGIARITHFDATAFQTQFAGEVKGFDASRYMDRREERRTDPYVHLAIAAAEEAIADAGLDWDRKRLDRVGVMIGTATGGILTLLENYDRLRERGPHRVSPFFLPAMTVDAAGAQIAIRYGLSGPSYATVSACASGANAIGEGTELIRRGVADIIIAGGSEKGVIAPALAGFNVMKALSTRNDDPAGASRPFDAARDGFVIAEGAAIMVLENEVHARARGAKVYAELAGYGTTVDGYHMAIPSEEGRGAQRTMELGLKDACISPEEVDYINAHGTSTPVGDVTETEAIKGVFGEGAYDIVINSTKSMTGHLFGAAGAMEAVVCAKTVETGIVHPTINYETSDPECDLDYVPNEAREMPVRVALSNSMGLGGHNATLILRRWS